MPLLNIPEVAKRLDRSTVALTIADIRQDDDPLVYVNPAFCRLTGYEAEDVLHRNCRFLQGNYENEGSRRIVRTALTEGKSAQTTFDNVRRDGSFLQTLLLLEPLHSRDGQLVFMVGSQFELTKRTTDADVSDHSGKVSDEIDRMLKLNEVLRANSRLSLARTAQATVRLWMKR